MAGISAFPFNENIEQDLHVDSNGNLVISEGLEDLRQRVLERIKLWRGELWLDSQRGVPFHQSILNSPGRIGLASQLITTEVLDVEGVVRVQNVSLRADPITRELFFSAIVVSPEGEVEVEVNGG